MSRTANFVGRNFIQPVASPASFQWDSLAFPSKIRLIGLMNRITAILCHQSKPWFQQILQPLIDSSAIRKILLVYSGECPPAYPKCETIEAPSLYNGMLWNILLKRIRTDFFLVIQAKGAIEFGPHSFERLVEAARISGAGMIYSDRWGCNRRGRSLHAVNDYQIGSLRDNFDFGPIRLFSLSAVRAAVDCHGYMESFQHAGLYDLRLKISRIGSFLHIPEPLYSVQESKQNLFDYVDPHRETVQKEMEAAAIAHLKSINAWVGPPFKAVPPRRKRFSVEASVVIPVRNRAATIADAVRSALSQRTDFPFNVIVVDNHSTDGTAKILSKLARQKKMVHLVPARIDLGIGGCWNEAVFSESCGRWAVQLDSDDLYNGPDVLQCMVDLLRQGKYAMVVGAYTLVNERLQEIPPGRVAHREWTDENGPNNALRVNGFGAPRAFDTALLRSISFLNVSYGEDYAMGLRISREYKVGRIYESLYFCRRWPGNTDASLSTEQINRNDAFKDTVRTLEILARQKMNREQFP